MTQKIQKLFKLPMLIGISTIATVIILCFYEFTVIEIFSIYFAARLQLMTCCLLEILLYAHPCQRITFESELIRQRLYNSCALHNISVSRLDKKKLRELKSCLILATTRANKLVEISAGGFITLNFAGYTDVSRDSHVYNSNISSTFFDFAGDKILLLSLDFFDSNSKESKLKQKLFRYT